jgi:nifR3 family TIM-barrel protein
MSHIWQNLPNPFFVLAPMEDVTDTVFRRIVGLCGRPDVYFTEFTSTEGMLSKGRDKVSKRLEYTEEERPLIAQIWGEKPEMYLESAKLLVAMGFDGIDINMGCPERSVLKKGACSALIQNPSLAKEIIQATKEGAGELPVSVKTRIGFQTIATEEWIGFLLEQNIPALSIHGRTVKELSEVPAHWDEIGKSVALRDQMKKDTLIIGNGDVISREDALSKIAQYKVDGIMIGRGIFADPWIFNTVRSGTDVTFDEKLAMLQRHLSLFESHWKEKKQFAIMKKFVKCYIHGIPGATDMRAKIMESHSFEQAQEIVGSFRKSLEVEA